MGKQTPLYKAHLDANARMVDFGGWDMPINYGSQLEEHHQVRRAAGMFDVSHMTVVDITGPQSRAFLSYLLANDVAKLQDPGKALYGCMLDHQGGVIDDLITYFLSEDHFRIVVNAATREKDMAWINQQASAFEVTVDEREELAMIAVQGPEARAKVVALLDESYRAEVESMKPFNAGQFGDLFIARTGYTGEDGFEIVLPPEQAERFWHQLVATGVAPCGLGARDTLRLEAGMNLYGQDMDESVTPLESALGWTLAMKDERDFIGKTALEERKAEGITQKLVGLILEQRGILRHGQKVVTPHGEGEITSGGFSPTLEKSIAFARIPKVATEGCEVDIRGKLLPVRLVRPPFVRNGKPCEGI